jgi:hypothetical protein
VEGDFTATGGNFTPTGGWVYFDGSSDSTIYGSPTFFEVDCNKSGGASVYLAADAAAYDTDLYGGNFDVNGYTLTTQYLDLWGGNLIINSGSCIVTNTGPYIRPGAVLTMSANGVLDSAGSVWFISGSSEAISGGSIYVEGWFEATAGDFTPTGGTVCFDSHYFSGIYGSPSFYNLRVNKSAGGSTYLYGDISAYAVNIDAGNLDINGRTATVTGPSSAGTAITLGDGANANDAYLAVDSGSVVDVTAETIITTTASTSKTAASTTRPAEPSSSTMARLAGFMASP